MRKQVDAKSYTTRWGNPGFSKGYEVINKFYSTAK